MQPVIINTLETFMICKRIAVKIKQKATRLANRRRFRHYFIVDQMIREESQYIRELKAIMDVVQKSLLIHAATNK
jgi:hypothetical protein